ncbi:DBH-like monooxygenase protein 1 [Bulinus truncatus]|nr:DBH-like monooxygenase protein 1 [Bulinus truncatus]
MCTYLQSKIIKVSVSSTRYRCLPPDMKLTITVAWTLVILGQIHSGVLSEDGSLSEQNLIYHEHLSDFYDLFWNFNKTHIMFKSHVKTNGYIGFGISPNGAMAHSDVVIGWVKDGKSYFADRHAEGNFKPAVDASQDWFLVTASEVGECTTLVFLRKLDTCDPEDSPLTSDTIRVIFSYSPTDPVDDDTILYHGRDRRGTKSIILLNPATSHQSSPPLPDDVLTIDFLNENYIVPSSHTTYRCKVLKLPDLRQKHHLIKYEPMIQTGRDLLVHHIIIYYCGQSVNSSHVGESYMCYYETPEELIDCINPLIVWAVGGQEFEFPLVAGYPLGRPEDPQILIMETHYNNPGLSKEFTDNSGLRLYLTKQLRQYDSGMIELGVIVDDHHIIPPFESSFLSTGHCLAGCLEKGLGDQEIQFFANFLHSHLLGRKLRTRHFRNGIELEPVMEDNSYDFNYQETRKLKEERIVKKGDSFIVECEYDSRGRTGVTYGGLNTTLEMCLSYLFYYPKIELTRCMSRVEYTVPSEYAGKDIYSLVKTFDWTDLKVRQQFEQSVKGSDILEMCWSQDINKTYYHIEPVPKYSQDYVPPNSCSN